MSMEFSIQTLMPALNLVALITFAGMNMGKVLAISALVTQLMFHAKFVQMIFILRLMNGFAALIVDAVKSMTNFFELETLMMTLREESMNRLRKL